MHTLPPVYLLHGWAVDEQNEQKWQAFRDTLKDAGISTTFLKIPGLSVPLNEVWKLDNFTEWLHEQLPAKGKVILIGHSFGGQLSTRYAARYPDKIEKLVLIDPAGVRPRSLKARLKRSIFWVVAKIGKVLLPGNFFRKLLYKVAKERDYFNASPLLRQTMANVINEEVLSDMKNITAQTLILWGSEDTATPAAHAQIFAQRIPNAQLHIVPEARHSPHFTHVIEVTSKVIPFIQKEKKS